jgi:heme-degrading monooxygenase HmoA
VPGYQLAQLNIAQLAAPLDSPRLRDFVDALEAVNAVADSAPGFVWRLQDQSGNATGVRPWGDAVVVNLSVWESVDALRAYVFGPAHGAVLRRRREWFVPMTGPHLVLWWVPAGHRPAPDDAIDRLRTLTEAGPTPAAFTLRDPFPAPAAVGPR